MTTITNTQRLTIALPDGQILRPREPTPISNWDAMQKNKTVQKWLKKGVLIVDTPEALVPDKPRASTKKAA